jgi:hypothetical protein
MRSYLAVVTCVVAVLVLGAKAQAAIQVYEGFDYSQGALTGDNGGIGWGDAWSTGTYGGDYASVVAPIGSVGQNAGVGNAAQGADYSAFEHRDFSSSLDLDAGANYATGGPGIPYYFSFLVNLSSTETIDNPIQIGLTTPGNPVYVQFGAGSSGTVNLSIAADPNNATNFVSLQTGTTYLIAGSFNAVFPTGPYSGIGQLNVSAYSDGSSIPSSAPSSWQLSYTDSSPGGYLSYNNLELSGFGGNYSDTAGAISLDEIRVGTDFSDVATGVPEPTCLGLTSLAAGLLLQRRRAARA